MKVKALLFDTRSIQKYIFSGNKLKTNIGASFLVDQLFSKFLVEDILQKELNYVSDVNEWKNSNEICKQEWIEDYEDLYDKIGWIFSLFY